MNSFIFLTVVLLCFTTNLVVRGDYVFQTTYASSQCEENLANQFDYYQTGVCYDKSRYECDYNNNQIVYTGYSDYNCTQINNGPLTYDLNECISHFDSDGLLNNLGSRIQLKSSTLVGGLKKPLVLGGNKFTCVPSLPTDLPNTVGRKSYQTGSCNIKPNTANPPQHLIYYPTGVCIPQIPQLVFDIDFTCGWVTGGSGYDSTVYLKDNQIYNNFGDSSFSGSSSDSGVCPGPIFLSQEMPFETTCENGIFDINYCQQ
eukprot:gene793-985_t